MPITLGLNLSSLKAQRQLGNSSEQLTSVFERLSSGQRINRASDDAAGLAIAESLNADTRVYAQGIRNLNDGISVLNVAEGALRELTNITVRLAELAEQAANGTFGVTQRASLDDEAQALKAEYFRIAKSTEFNGRKLFEGDYGVLSLQAGYGSSGSISEGLGGAIGDGTFQQVSTLTIGSTGSDLETGDFNGDGNLDIVSVDDLNDTFTVSFGSGNGTFSSTTSYSSGDAPFGVVTGDINADGILDILTANVNSADVSIRLGNGDGTFGAESTIDLGAAVNDIKIADFDNDGSLDIIATHFIAGDISLVYGNGDGTFEAPSSVALTSAWSVAVGDFNADGLADAAITSDSQVTYLIGTSDRSLVGGSVSTDASFAQGVVIADFNGDGADDIATANATTDNVSIILGNGDGSFQAASTYAAGDRPRGLDAGDINGDGILDIITADEQSGTASVLLGNGDGSFGAATSYDSGSFPATIAIRDFNNDGVLDFASGHNASITLFLANTSHGVSPLLDFSLETVVGAKQALTQFQQKLTHLTTQRGQIGAFQSRIEVAERVLGVSVENFRAAESRIRDADIATDSANLVRLQILQQASAAVLGQANLQPQLVLRLLGVDG